MNETSNFKIDNLCKSINKLLWFCDNIKLHDIFVIYLYLLYKGQCLKYVLNDVYYSSWKSGCELEKKHLLL